MDVLVEMAALALVALAAGTLMRRAVARRAEARTAAVAVAVPCQARWRQGVRRRFFGYGRLRTGADGAGAVFAAPCAGRSRCPWPAGRSSARAGGRGCRCWSTGLRTGGGSNFQVCDAEAARTARLRGVPDPADLG
ncbi:hypothetical protein ABZY81_12475 [Streptomyces sp. NPDC006514]|uniref:hypothetical protein n=1 Tax=Streptomyces sp. NPDC006514 TaxID=3154308 RepID=UPI0033AB68BE